MDSARLSLIRLPLAPGPRHLPTVCGPHFDTPLSSSSIPAPPAQVGRLPVGRRGNHSQPEIGPRPLLAEVLSPQRGGLGHTLFSQDQAGYGTCCLVSQNTRISSVSSLPTHGLVALSITKLDRKPQAGLPVHPPSTYQLCHTGTRAATSWGSHQDGERLRTQQHLVARP